MAEGRGGYRRPRQPAPVSGPGQLSRRTDGGPQQTTQPMTGMGYGENAEFDAVQGAAPLAATPSVSNARTRSMSPTGQGVAAVPLFSNSGFPEEPVTAGASMGPGPGPSSSIPIRRQTLADSLNILAQYDNSGELEVLARRARRLGW